MAKKHSDVNMNMNLNINAYACVINAYACVINVGFFATLFFKKCFLKSVEYIYVDCRA